MFQKNYIRKLVEIFRTCEDLENVEGLHLMFKIVKGISELNHRCSSTSILLVYNCAQRVNILFFSFQFDRAAGTIDLTGSYV